MRWTPGRRSANIEDRRGQGFGTGARMGLGGTAILLVLSLLFGRDFLSDAGGGGPVTTQEGGAVATTPEEERLVEFVSFVLDDVQNTWERVLPTYGTRYRQATLVLFRDATSTGCGVGQSVMGPFYCPVDEKVYIDLSFYEELRRRFGAPGDFAQAYVLAHEVGHHVQHLEGLDEQMRRAQQSNPDMANDLSVRLELQADCFAGVWGHSAAQRDLLSPGDVEEGLGAAAAVGDDRLSEGRVSRENFTHGTSQQRASWFRRGLDSGDPRVCDTFGGRK